MKDYKKERLNNRVQIGLSDYDLVNLKSEFLKTNFNSFSRFCNAKLTAKYYLVNTKVFMKLFSDLARIGSNINQISKELKSGNLNIDEFDFDVLKELNLTVENMKKVQYQFLEQKL